MSDTPFERPPTAGGFLHGLGEMLAFVFAVCRALVQFGTGRWPEAWWSPAADDTQVDEGQPGA